MITCEATGRTFEPSVKEMELRKKLGVEGVPTLYPAFRFLQLGAFWQHFTLHKRKCDRTGKEIISVFGPDCPYPVWHKDEWIKHADPPGADFDDSKEVFPQMWEFFQKSAIPHNTGAGNENCEYTDDWWYSRNCYLCHNGVKNEDIRYCFRCLKVRDSQQLALAWQSELCFDSVNIMDCYHSVGLICSRQCRDSAFLYDCRNCSDSMFCWNLRNKKYCFMNEQLSKEEYEQKKKEWDLRSRKTYEKAWKLFRDIIQEQAWHLTLNINLSENSTGDHLDGCQNCENCFIVGPDAQDCVNVFRAALGIRDILDSISLWSSELVFYSSLVQDQCYDIKYCYDLTQCKSMEYSAKCFQSENCFGCCGLVGKKYHIFNKLYSPEEYKVLKGKIIEHMKAAGEYGKFFPGYFSAVPYEESLAYYHWPLDKESCKKFGFRVRETEEKREVSHCDPSEIPDRCDAVNETLYEKVFWDEKTSRPFRIEKADVVFCWKMGVPLPHSYYSRHLQELYRWVPFNGELRTTSCGQCRRDAQTSWPKEYDGRILCEECYLKEVV